MEPQSARKRKWLRRSLVAAGLFIAAVLVVAATGYPQKWSAEWAIERNFGMIARIEWSGTVPQLRAKRLRLYPSRSACKADLPVISATNVRVEYAPFERDRVIRKVGVGTLLINVDPEDPALRDLPFLRKPPEGPAAPSGTGDSTFLPREFDVQEFTVRVHRADGTSMVAEAGRVEIKIVNPDSISISVQNDDGHILVESGDSHVFVEEVELTGRGTYESGYLTWEQSARAPGVCNIALTAEGPTRGNDPHLNFKVANAELAGDRVAKVLESAAAPVKFKEFAVESASGRIGLSGEPAFTLSAAARVYSIGLPDAAEPLYGDSMRVLLTAQQADGLSANATVAFAQGQSARVAVTGDADTGNASVLIAGWTLSQLAQVLPAAFRESVEDLGFETFSSDAQLRWTKLGYQIDGHAQSRGGGADAETIAWTMNALGARDGSQSLQGTAEAQIGDRRVRASAKYVDADHYIAEASIEEIDLRPWVELAAGKGIAASFGGTIEGTIRAEAVGKGAPLEIRPNVTLKKFVYDDLALDEITLKGAAKYADSRLMIDELRVEAPDGMTAAVLSNWDYDFNDDAGAGAFTVDADLGILARLTGADIGGTGGTEGTIRIDRSNIEARVLVRSSDLRIGDIWLPTSAKLNAGGVITYGRQTRRGHLREWQATLGEGTALRMGDVAYSAEPLEAEADVVVESDLQVLVGMNWLSSAEGALNAKAKARLAKEKTHVDWDLRVTAPAIVLADNAGQAEGLEFNGAGTYTDGLTGIGQISAAKLRAAGGSVVNPSGPVLFDGELMRIQQAKGGLFTGIVSADVDIGVLKPELPISLSGRFEDADLAIFTDEVKPPRTELTGKARGTVELTYGSKGLSAFEFEAEAPEGLSVNRSLVAELLQTDKFLSGASANVAEKAMDKLLGTAPQRPFERGHLNVSLSDDKITGLAVLESQQTKDYHGLNLRVTLDMDQAALEQALQMLQETGATSVDISGGRPAQ